MLLHRRIQCKRGNAPRLSHSLTLSLSHSHTHTHSLSLSHPLYSALSIRIMLTCASSINNAAHHRIPSGDQFCGDGRVSDTEVCDCGSTNPAICAANDPCCTTECTLVPDAECSNVKSDQCCTSQCKFKGLDFETTMELYTREIPSAGSGSASFAETYEAEFRKRFPSSKNKAGEEENPVPKCAEETSCFREQYCIADPLFKGSCPKMDFVLESTQSVGEQTACFDYGCKLEQDADTGNRCKMELDDVPYETKRNYALSHRHFSYRERERLREGGREREREIDPDWW